MIRFILVLFFLILIHNIISPLQSKDYWGLRNIEMDYDNNVYQSLNPQYIAWGFQWDRLENPDDNFNWSYIDNVVDFTASLDAKVVFLLTPTSSWASYGEPKAPNDLDRLIALDDPIPERGYSEILYDYTYKIIERVAKRNKNVLGYLRYGNEPQYPDHWKISDSTYQQDVEDFIRCLRTVYIAAHKAAEDNDATIMVSHGGFYYNDQLERLWYEYGEANTGSQDSLLLLYNSKYERQAPKPIYKWTDFKRRMENQSGMPPPYWMDIIAGQTDWLDWFDIHYHFKPRFIFDDMEAFEKAVIDSGGTLKPWFAAEAAMQIEEAGTTEYVERFHAGDMVRKWIFGITTGLEGICTPVIGAPPDRFFGLYSDQDKRYLSADAYVFIHSLIQPESLPEDLSVNEIAVYRFNEKNIIDIIWYDALFDTVQSTKKYIPEIPEEYRHSEDGFFQANIYDIFGNKIQNFTVGDIPELKVSQEPIVIIWDVIPDTTVTTELRKYEPPDGFIYHGVGWNYNNSVSLYQEMMPEDRQPLLLQTMSAIPGTRPISVEKILGGLNYPYQDPDKQYVEYGIHFQKTQEEPYDSVFAYTNEMDHYMDSLAIAFKQHGKPFFLRIGGEMNGSWNNYTAYTYPKAFRKLVLGLRERGVNNFATVWCYEPAAPGDFADSTGLGWKWYPGDDVVDWFGLDVFPVRDFGPDEPDTGRDGGLSPKGKSELFLKWARDKNYPVYINETTAHSENIIADSEDPGNEEGKKIWEHWFIPFFRFFENHPEIKAFNYINLNWTPIDRYKDWGDCRLEINSYIKDRWIEELSKPKYIHKGYDIGQNEVGIKENNSHLSNDGMLIYPNPFSDKLNIRIENPVQKQCNIKIVDITGRTIYENLICKFSDNILIKTENWKSGIYFLILINGNDLFVKSITHIE
jgi:hypothetical protein